VQGAGIYFRLKKKKLKGGKGVPRKFATKNSIIRFYHHEKGERKTERRGGGGIK